MDWTKEQKQAIVTSNVSVKSSTKFIAKTLDRVKKGSTVVVISIDDKYAKIRTVILFFFTRNLYKKKQDPM